MRHIQIYVNVLRAAICTVLNEQLTDIKKLPWTKGQCIFLFIFFKSYSLAELTYLQITWNTSPSWDAQRKLLKTMQISQSHIRQNNITKD